MLKFIFVLFLPFSFLAQTLTVQSPVRFLALGDSYTIGESVSANESWPKQFVDSLAQRGVTIDTLRIIAKTGWRADNLINAITNQQLDKQHYNLVAILIGVNNQYQSRPISEYVQQFPQLLDSAIRYAGGDTNHVFIVSIPDYAATPNGQESNPENIKAGINNYNSINKYFADKYHIRYFDITPISRLGLFRPYLVADDGLHPSSTQYSAWVKLILNNDLMDVLNDFADKELLIYPNAVSDKLSVFYPLKINKVLELFDSSGKSVLKQEMNGELIDLSLKDLNKGIYTLRLVYKGGQISKKVIKY